MTGIYKTSPCHGQGVLPTISGISKVEKDVFTGDYCRQNSYFAVSGGDFNRRNLQTYLPGMGKLLAQPACKRLSNVMHGMKVGRIQAGDYAR